MAGRQQRRLGHGERGPHAGAGSSPRARQELRPPSPSPVSARCCAIFATAPLGLPTPRKCSAPPSSRQPVQGEAHGGRFAGEPRVSPGRPRPWTNKGDSPGQRARISALSNTRRAPRAGLLAPPPAHQPTRRCRRTCQAHFRQITTHHELPAPSRPTGLRARIADYAARGPRPAPLGPPCAPNRHGRHHARPARPGEPPTLISLTLVGAFAFWAWLDRGLWFFGDEWDFLVSRGLGSCRQTPKASGSRITSIGRRCRSCFGGVCSTFST